MKSSNWPQIKEFLLENFIEQDFKPYQAFKNIDFEKGLEFFRYILVAKLLNHNESKAVFEALQMYLEGKQDKDVLDKLISKYEAFAKKIFEIIGIQNNTNGKVPALGWCYNNLFKKLNISQNPHINEFFSTNSNGKIENPSFQSAYFENNFLTDGTPHGKSLHKSYHIRNSQIHNDQPIIQREIPNCINDCIISYLYFVYKYYNELDKSITSADLNSTISIEIISLASLSGGAYNPKIENEIHREGIIQTIENKLSKSKVLIIEGDQGIGKTTLLHQFIDKHESQCFSYFIDSRDKNTYTVLSVLQAFCNQIHFFTKGKELYEDIRTESFYDETFLKDYFNGVKLRVSQGKNLYFIIDGLDQVNEDDQLEIKENILDLIPNSKDEIKVLLTGKYNVNLFSNKTKIDNWEVPLLSPDESKAIFGSSINQGQFLEINKLCKNNAGKLVFIRELSKTGISLNNIIENITNNINDLYSFLWNSFYEKDDNLLSLVLSIIAFEGKKYSLDKIAEILSSPPNMVSTTQLENLIDTVPFVRRNQRDTYEFIFEGFTDFARKKLFNYKKSIDSIIINYLIENSNTKDSLINLPEMYRETGKIDDLLKLLGEDRWKQLLEQSESISDVSRVSTTALQAIKDNPENKYIPTILKYSVLKSALKELSQISIWQYEIAANLSLGDDINAINLANIAFLKEDRLKLFASIAKTYTKKQINIPPSIIKTIQDLYAEIDFKNMGSLAVEIASLLMYSNAKLAFKLIESLSGSIADNDNAFDWALAQMSLSAYKDLKESEDVTKEDVNSKVYSKIRNPQIKQFADAVLYLSENLNLEEIIEKINELESTSQKLFLIRNWILNNKEDKEISRIVDLGIKLVINKSDKYVPKANDFKIFAITLPYIENKEKAIELISKIEQQIVAIEFTSSVNDVLNIKLLIAQCLCNFEFKEGEEKLSLIYDEICSISDLALKATCLAIYANSATKIKNKFPEKNIEIYSDSACDDIMNGIDVILNQTAEHFEIVQGILKNLVNIYPERVVNICQKLNKAIDRDNAYLESLTTYLRNDIEKVDTLIIDAFLDKISDYDLKKMAVFEIFHRFESENKNKKVPKNLYKYFNLIDEVFDNESKCALYVVQISILENEKQSIVETSDKLKDTWHNIERSANKIEVGFEIAFKASFLEDKSLAKYFLSHARQEKENPELLLDSPNTAYVYYLTIDLAVRLFSGLILKNVANENDLENLESIISSLPSQSHKILLWSNLVLKIAPKASKSFSQRIINNHIIPKLSRIKNNAERIEIIMEIVPVLFINDPTLSILEELPAGKFKDVALSKTCKYLLTNCLPDDLCDDNGDGFPVDYETVKKILDLVRRISNDYFISWQIDELRKSINSPLSKISANQIAEIKVEIDKIAFEKLPDLNNIKHKGYQVLVKAYALSIQRQSRKEDWINLLKEVETIPNLSDRIFLWVSFASIVPTKHEFSSLKLELIDKASKLSYELPSFLDTVSRVSMIFTTLRNKKIEGVNLKSLIGIFLNAQKTKDINPKLRDKYRQILNVAYQTDPNIARVFINMFDNDPARKNTGAYLNNHMNYLEFESKIEQKLNPKLEKDLIEQKLTFFNRIINRKLALLNGSKISSDNLLPKDITYVLDIAAQRSIYDSHNAFLYFIERLILKYESTDEAERIIRKSFLELLEVCNLVKLLSIRNADKIKSLFDIISNDFNSNDIEELNSLKIELGEQLFNNIEKLLEKDFTTKEVSSMLNVHIDKVEIILRSFSG